MKRVLVIGDGQLGLMLAGAAARLGVELDRLSPEGCVLYRGTGRASEPLRDDWSAEEYDIVTAEREHLPECALMERLRAHPGFGAAATLATVSDRRSQKALFDRLAVPTAEWIVPRSLRDIEGFLRAHDSRAILKAARGGYDGRGQWRVTVDGPIPDPREHPAGLIAERAVHFQRELSLVGARFADGRTAYYPLVQNHHADGMLRCTVAPAETKPAQQRCAEQMLGAIMRELDYVGVMALELFEEDGRLLVNELAPRVHNSGHWSQAGAGVDQFELHLRALCGLPPGVHAPCGFTVMLNLVGTGFDPRWLGVAGVDLHWYGKSPAPRRKLGHLNLHASGRAELAGVIRRLLPLLDEAHASAARDALATLTANQRASDLALTRQRNRTGAPAAACTAR